MNKLELIDELSKRAGISRQDARNSVGIFFDSMTAELTAGKRVEIRGLCSFYVKDYPAYTGRNPKTGKKVVVEAKRLPFFKCGRELKDRVDQRG